MADATSALIEGATEQPPIEITDNGGKSLAELMAGDKRFSDPNTDWDAQLNKPEEDDFDTREVDEQGFRKYDDDGNRIDQLGNVIEDDKKETEAKVDTPPVETKPEEKPTATEIPADVQERLKQLDFFEKTFAEQPLQMAAAILKDADPRQRAAFMAEMGMTQAESTREQFDFSEYEPATDAERYILSRGEDIEAIPHVIADTAKLRADIDRTREQFGVPIDHANLQVFDLRAAVDVILDHLGISLPKADFKAMVEELKSDGRKTYGSVIGKHIEQYASAAKNAKQREVERPTDPGRTTREPVATKPKPNSSLMDLINSDPELRARARQFMKES